MTGVTAIAFVDELTVIHVVDESTGCPRGVPRWVRVDDWSPENGTVLRVDRCAAGVGHDGPCVPGDGRRRAVQRTRCGIVVDRRVWIDYPADAAEPCPRCHGVTVTDDDPLF